MARIYIGRTTGIGSFERHVVLKLILPERANDITAVHMFLDEARLAAALNHQNVAQVFEVGEDGGIHYLAMEYVHGQDLRALLAKAGSQGSRVPLELALTVVAGAAAGLNHAHERRGPDGVPLGIVHRDVSPSNIMIGYDGSVKLLDFGIAKATLRSVETQSGIIKGKFAYMAPEQCRGRDVDRRSDVFSLGIILYEISTQHRCFRADSDFDTMHRIVTGDVVRPTRLVPNYPPALEAIVMKALAVDTNQRYQSAGALLEAIEAFSVGSRMSLSTMGLGRFMRDMFGEMSEPWLNNHAGRNQPLQPRESTISNTNGTGSEVNPAPAVPPAAAAPAEPARTILDLPRGESEDPDNNSSANWNAKSYPTMQPAYASEETLSPEPISPMSPAPPSLRQSQPNLNAIPATPHVARESGPLARESAPLLPPPPAVIPSGPATPPGGHAIAMPPDPRPVTGPISGPLVPTSTPQPFQTPGSGTGPAIVASQYPVVQRGDMSRPQFLAHYEARSETADAALQLTPNRRPLYVVLGVVGVGLAIMIAVLMSGGKKDEEPGPGDQPVVAVVGAEAGLEVVAPPVAAPIDAAAVAAVKLPVVTPPSDAAAEAPPPVPVVEEMVAIHINSVPPGGDVILDGEFVGVAPVDIKRKRQNKHGTLLVRHKGYDDTKSTLDLSGDASRTVTLTKKPDTQAGSNTEHPKQPDHPKNPVTTPDHPKNPVTPPVDAKKKCQLPGQYNPYDSRPVCK
jgi:serine/threonine-protein kinase